MIPRAIDVVFNSVEDRQTEINVSLNRSSSLNVRSRSPLTSISPETDPTNVALIDRDCQRGRGGLHWTTVVSLPRRSQR